MIEKRRVSYFSYCLVILLSCRAAKARLRGHVQPRYLRMAVAKDSLAERRVESSKMMGIKNERTVNDNDAHFVDNYLDETQDDRFYSRELPETSETPADKYGPTDKERKQRSETSYNEQNNLNDLPDYKENNDTTVDTPETPSNVEGEAGKQQIDPTVGTVNEYHPIDEIYVPPESHVPGDAEEHPSGSTEQSISDDKSEHQDETTSNDDLANFEGLEKQYERQETFMGAYGLILAVTGMIFTAWQMSDNPDGIFAALCRLVITMVGLVCRIIFSPCRKCMGRNTNGHYGHIPVSTMDYGYGRDPSLELS